MKIFVYGTLLEGLHNHHYLVGAAFIKHAETLPNFTMISLGGFPGVMRNGDTAIKGEVYEVDSRTLKRLDRLENHPVWYKREVIALSDGDEAAIYIHPPTPIGQFPTVESGSWNEYVKQGV